MHDAIAYKEDEAIPPCQVTFARAGNDVVISLSTPTIISLTESSAVVAECMSTQLNSFCKI